MVLLYLAFWAGFPCLGVGFRFGVFGFVLFCACLILEFGDLGNFGLCVCCGLMA